MERFYFLCYSDMCSIPTNSHTFPKHTQLEISLHLPVHFVLSTDEQSGIEGHDVNLITGNAPK